MGKDWDRFAPPRTAYHGERADTSKNITAASKQCDCPEPVWEYEQPDGPPTRMVAYYNWCRTWAAELFRIAKPGAHLLSFGGTRTWHRLACAIEDGGWEIRDCLMWLYGAGFPKALDISKAIDREAGAERERIVQEVTKAADLFNPERKESKEARHAAGLHGGSGSTVGRFSALPENAPDEDGLLPVTAPATPAAAEWEGWKTGLKPAWEPIILAMKPPAGSYAKNAQEYGVAGLNVDGCRIGSAPRVNPSASENRIYGQFKGQETEGRETVGRYPSNVILDPEAADLVDAQSGEIKANNPGPGTRTVEGLFGPEVKGKRAGGIWTTGGKETDVQGHVDTGGASRFFYCAKATRQEKIGGWENLPRSKREKRRRYEDRFGSWVLRAKRFLGSHPTVKPLSLMEYLCRLTSTPSGGVVLDPFLGSGSTAMAAVLTGRKYIGIEKGSDYCRIARARIKNVVREPELWDNLNGGK
jgi:site-specific DNA-methyltransferase (adenine-specific)